MPPGFTPERSPLRHVRALVLLLPSQVCCGWATVTYKRLSVCNYRLTSTVLFASRARRNSGTVGSTRLRFPFGFMVRPTTAPSANMSQSSLLHSPRPSRAIEGCRADTQRRETRQSAIPTIDQAETRDQSQDSERARLPGADDHANELPMM